MNFYKKHILPHLLSFAMKKESMEKHRAEVTKNASGVVLEIGFGSGLNVPYYKNITKLYALEPYVEFYNLSKENRDKANFTIEQITASAEKVPLQNESVDTVISTWTMCTIRDTESALKEIHRILKPNGKFVFIEHGKTPNKFYSGLQNIFTPFTKKLAGGCHLNRDIESLIKNSPLKISTLDKFVENKRPLAYMYRGIAIK